MNRDYLAIDLGAESGRAILAQVAKGRIELQELHRFPNIPVQLPTGLYWDTLRLFHEICEGIRCGAKAVDEIDGIAIDTWGVDFGLVGADGELLHMPRHYRDNRNVGTLGEVFELVPRQEIFRQTGIQFMEINSLYQLWVMRRDSPEILDRASKLLFMPDLFNYFLTGTYAAERTIASTSQFYDPVKKGFATDMLRQLGISGSFFPELVDPAIELGPVLPYAANRCGLKHDTPVYTTGSHDTASAVAAVPAVGDGWCYISSGTWSLMGVEAAAPIINEASLEANFTNEIGVAGSVRFLKNIPGLWVLQECRRAWAKAGSEYTYAELTGHASEAKAIETVLDLDQFISPGDHPERIRHFCATTGQEIPGDVGSMTRVVLQSLAERYRQVLELLERLTKKSIDTIHIVGGGSQNLLLNQMVADRTGRRVVAGPAEATALGNALTQAMGTGQIHSLEEMRAVVRGSFELHEFTPKA
jgi:rhamnulokinase